jgi:hypothetical protein
MNEPDPGKLSALLAEARAGNAGAREQLFAAMYGELRRYLFAAAAQAMRRTLVDDARQPGPSVRQEPDVLDEVVAGFAIQNIDFGDWRFARAWRRAQLGGDLA